MMSGGGGWAGLGMGDGPIAAGGWPGFAVVLLQVAVKDLGGRLDEDGGGDDVRDWHHWRLVCAQSGHSAEVVRFSRTDINVGNNERQPFRPFA